MQETGKAKLSSGRLRLYSWAIGILGTLLVAASLARSVVDIRHHTIEDARSQAHLYYQKDIAFRGWNASHGGVYVPVTNSLQPITYLSDLPERDITTPSGKVLTLINPACMMRLVYERSKSHPGIRGHLTSLKPIRPENGPDPWEAEALRSLESGTTEAYSVEEMEGQSFLRLMYPMVTEKNCLKCHSRQGYKEGDIRGGTSVSVAMEPFLAHQRRDILWMTLAHGFLWIVGLNGLLFGAGRLSRSEQERKQALEELRKAHDDLEVRVSERTRELEGVNRVLLEEIAERRRVEGEHVKLATAIEQAAESIIITDKNGGIEYVNPAFERVSGFGRAELRGQNFRILKSDKHDDAFYHQMWKDISSGKMWTGRLSNTVRDGSLLEFETSISPIRNGSGAIINFVSVNRDVTREVRLQEQLRQAQKMEAIGTLAGGIAHDFNNILSIIMGYTQMAMFGIAERAQIRGYLEDILKASNRAADLVRQILTFSRQTRQEFRPMEVCHIVKEVVKMLRASLPSTIEIKHNVADESMVLADPTQIHQVLMNLCTNGAHAMHPKGGVLEVSLLDTHLTADFVALHPGASPGKYIRLSVTDTGCGMDSQTLERIFEPYFTTKRQGEGTGLGLAVVHGIVKDHGGIITVYSELGVGTTFTVFLPKFESRAALEKEDMVDFSGGNERILLVDDETMLCNITMRMLEHLGYTVTARTSGIEALEVFSRKPDAFDLVLTDVTMPKMTGIELGMEILAIRPGIPIILCTGFSDLVTPERVKALGVRELLMKPLVMSDLASALRQVLGDNKPKGKCTTCGGNPVDCSHRFLDSTPA
jgi:PAS domain S-box-containing protein